MQIYSSYSFASSKKAIEPSFGPYHKHFSKEELEWIAEDIDFGTAQKIMEFSREQPYLHWLEANIEELNKVKPIDLLPLMFLANYGRIKLPLELTLSVSRWPSGENALVTRHLLDIVWNYCVNEMGRSPDHYGEYSQKLLILLIMHTGKPLDQAVLSFDSFEERYTDVCKRHGRNMLHVRIEINSLRKVLAHMGYDIEVRKEKIGRLLVWGKDGTSTDNPEVNKTVELYGNYVINNSLYKTASTVLSHIRVFAHWFAEVFPQISMRELGRYHITAYLSYLDEYVKPDGKQLARATINHKVEALKAWIDWLQKHNPETITSNIVISKLDCIFESKQWTKRISQTEAKLVFEIINKMDERQWFAAKMVLIIMALTGLRISSVISLKHDCLIEGPVGSALILQRAKGELSEKRILVSPKVSECIHRAQHYFRAYTAPLYSCFDGLSIRRLFVGEMGASTVSDTSIRAAFEKAQKDNGLVNLTGEAKFGLHDLRRIFASALLAQGLSPEEVASFMMQRDVNSLFPYEVYNLAAVNVFKRLNDSKILVGRQETVSEDQEKSSVSSAIDEITKLLSHLDIRQRQITNFLARIEKPEESMPLIHGTCICGEEIDCDSDDLTCLGCDNYEINKEKLGLIGDYLKKVLYQKWLREKKGIEMPGFQMRLDRVVQRVFVHQMGMGQEEALDLIKKLERDVVPKRGRPSRKDKILL